MLGLPLRLLRPFLGPRIIKTGLAVFIALVVFHQLGPNYAAFGALAAVLAVQPSLAKARQVFLEQLLGNFVGGSVAVLLGLWLGAEPLTVAAGVVLVLGLLSRTGHGEAASLAMFAVLFVMDRPEHDFLPYALARVAVITGGMFIGFLVNRFVMPPDFTGKLHEELTKAEEAVHQLAERITLSLGDPAALTKESVKELEAKTQKHLQSADLLLRLAQETRGRAFLYEQKLRSTLFVCLDRLLDIHKTTLEAAGLHEGTELRAVTAAMFASTAYKRDIAHAALGQSVPSSAKAVSYHQAMADLDSIVRDQVCSEESRERGLLMHSLSTSLRQMGWRTESLDRLIRSHAGG